MNASRQTHRLYLAVCVNAALLLLILLSLILNNGHFSGDATALAQPIPSEPPAPNARPLNVMPAQLSPQVWGCYVMDSDNQTLSVYQYSPVEHQLRLAAARDIQYDRHLRVYNTSPSPAEIKEMVERAQEPARAVAPEK